MSYTESIQSIQTFAIGCYETTAANTIYFYNETAELVNKNYPPVRDFVKDYSGRIWTWIKNTAKTYPFATVLVANFVLPFLAKKVGDCVRAIWLELFGDEQRKITPFSDAISWSVAVLTFVAANITLAKALDMGGKTFVKAAAIGAGAFGILYFTKLGCDAISHWWNNRADSIPPCSAPSSSAPSSSAPLNTTTDTENKVAKLLESM